MTAAQSSAAMAIPRRFPWCTALLCGATAAVSIQAAIEVSGTWLERVRIERGAALFTEGISLDGPLSLMRLRPVVIFAAAALAPWPASGRT